LFLSVAGGRTHIGTYVGVSPSPASNENNKLKNSAKNNFAEFFNFRLIHSLDLQSIVFESDMRDN